MPSCGTVDPRLPKAKHVAPPQPIVPRTEWDRAPWNRWSFQHVRELLPTAEVWRGDGPVRHLPRAEVDLDELPVSGCDGARTTLHGLLEDTFTDGFVVLHEGTIVYERYLNGMGPRTPHLSESVSKSMVGALVGILASRGLLDPSGLVTDYLPELEATAYAGATLQDLLDMRSGVHFSEDYSDPYSEVGMMDVACGWKPRPAGAKDFPEHMWELVLRLRTLDRPHGSAFDYRSIETDVIAFILEHVSGKRLPQLLSDEIWSRIGAEESASFTVDPAGYALACGGFNATLRDYARFGQLLLDGGGSVVPKAWIDAARDGGHHGPEYWPGLPTASYKNQFWIEDDGDRTLMCVGIFGQLIWINWRHRMVAVKLSSWPVFEDEAMEMATFGMLHDVAAAIEGRRCRAAAG
ncbi:6-aminohexanoate-dimer hydrolase [Hyaloraphidium curvatum]|nr:6-aminohexanoate-dimer hydrolase [Hyaloraphidium curvatum]